MSNSVSYNPDKHHRQSTRLPNYDYSDGGIYFITICCYQKQCLFGEVVDGTMWLNKLGQIVAEEWLKSPQLRQEIELDEWVVMPNHFHGIVIFNNTTKPVGAQGIAPLNPLMTTPKPSSTNIPQRKPKSLGSFVAGFKMAVTKRVNILRETYGVSVWQRNYYEHIIRNQESLDKIRQYVQNNPLSWHLDQLNPINPSKW
jgi:putative transposase